MRTPSRAITPEDLARFHPAPFLDAAGATYDARIWDDVRRRAALNGDGPTVPHGTSDSPTRHAVDRLQAVNAAIQERELPTEDQAALKRQLDRYLNGKKTKLLEVDFKFRPSRSA